jgi:amino acid adenylation domain-containing protein
MNALLQHWVIHQAEKRPDALAVIMGPERLTYGQLENTSNRLARLLKRAGCHKGDRVCFLMPKSCASIVSMLGILKTGCVYVPLDPASPTLRMRKILECCENRWLLAAGPVLQSLSKLLEDSFADRISVGWMEHQKPAGARFRLEWSLQDVLLEEPTAPEEQTSSTDAAHILFTSGSTGVPKGVVITHSNVIHFVEWALRHFGIDASDRLSGCTPLHFDLSTFDVFGTFAAGAELHMLSHELCLSPIKLAEFIRIHGLTQWFSVPSVLNYMAQFDAVRPNDFPRLKRVLWCGEVLPTPALIYWMQRLPHVRFTNLYGPTETTIASSFYDIPACPANKRALTPIGQGCEGEELLILDENLRPVPEGQAGDLYISGVGLSPGYWRDPEKTAAAFLPDPRPTHPNHRIYRSGDLARRADGGLVYFIGRKDTQIKSRGYRIELGEIEAALSCLAGLEEAAVVAIETGGFEGWLICCAYVLPPDSHSTANDVRKDLEKHLPAYMIPARWMVCHALPRNANGKIDRPKLTELFLQSEDRGGMEARRHSQTAVSAGKST